MQYLVNLATKELVYQALDAETITLTDTQAIVSGGSVFGFVNSSNSQVITESDAIFSEWVEEIVVKRAKLTGVEILGVMCSATGKDQSGLSAVAVGAMRAEQAGQTFADTSFKFENGAELVITAANFADIEAVWTPFRQSFFSP